MRPSLKAGLLPVWRDRDTIQFGVDPRRAVALGGLGQAAAVISLLDGSRDRDALIGTAQAYGVPPQATDRVLGLLAAAGVLDDFPARLHAALPDQLRARLAPELATASLAYADGDGGARTLARRRAAFVRVHGAGRTGACVASLLAASGVGHVTCTDPEPAEPADLAPAGLLLADVGAPRAEGAARAISRAAPEVSTHDDGAVPDLAILTGPALPDLADGLLRDRVPHLAVRACEAIGVVGPLVQPAKSACLRCVDRHKADGDPQWPKVLAQATFARVQPQACDTVLAAMTAAVAAGQALAFIDRAGMFDASVADVDPIGLDPIGLDPADGDPVRGGRAGVGRAGGGRLEPGTVNGTLELVLPGWQWRRRTWRPHPACRCGAVRQVLGDGRDRPGQPVGAAVPRRRRPRGQSVDVRQARPTIR